MLCSKKINFYVSFMITTKFIHIGGFLLTTVVRPILFLQQLPLHVQFLQRILHLLAAFFKMQMLHGNAFAFTTFSEMHLFYFAVFFGKLGLSRSFGSRRSCCCEYIFSFIWHVYSNLGLHVSKWTYR